MVAGSYDNTLTKKFENKTWISKIIWWLNSTTELIISMQFFAWVIFWSFFPKMMDQKVTLARKVGKMKNQFFHARQPRAEIFDFCTQQNCSLTLLYWGVHYLQIIL